MTDVFISDKSEVKWIDYTRVGSHIAIDSWVYISTQLFLGDYIHIAHHVCIIGGKDAIMRMDDFTNIGAGSKIVVRSDDFKQGMINPIVPAKYRNVIGGEILMERFATIGVNCTVLPGCDMAEGSILGANSLLTKPTLPWTVYAGSPAKPIGERDKKWILASAKEMGYEY